ncbi:hypothetical protein GMDG_09016, partial [Pseudogymnoascus destructans 20631-21]
MATFTETSPSSFPPPRRAIAHRKLRDECTGMRPVHSLRRNIPLICLLNAGGEPCLASAAGLGVNAGDTNVGSARSSGMTSDTFEDPTPRGSAKPVDVLVATPFGRGGRGGIDRLMDALREDARSGRFKGCR